MRKNMEFLLQYSSSALSNRISLLVVLLFVICVCLWLVITMDELYKFGKIVIVTFLLLGSLFLSYYIYDSVKGLNELNEISKGNIEQYYNIEKIGDVLLFSEKENYKSLKDTFSSNIKEETYSDYVLLVENKKVLIPKSIVK